jgi:hypothetical protein
MKGFKAAANLVMLISFIDAAGAVVELRVFATARYHRVVYVNGGTIQGQFIINSAYLRI